MTPKLAHQLSLFDDLPWPHRPLCADDLSRGLYRAPQAEALSHAYIQHNPAAFVWAMVFDVDRPGAAVAWQDAGLPPPTWTTQNPRNGHAHLAYRLQAPVSRSELSRLRPLRLLARVQHSMTAALAADRAYAGLITKTPRHERWRTEVWRPDAYDLDELRDWLPDHLPLPPRITKRDAIGVGRNVCLFDGLRRWAYRARLDFDDQGRWLDACHTKAAALNTFADPLPCNEVKATAKSVSTWTWIHFTPQAFAAIQTHRSRLASIARRAAAMDSNAPILEFLL